MRRSDKAKLLELFSAEILAIVLVVSLVLRPAWVGAVIVIGATAVLVVLADFLFPPVAAEAPGSAAHAKRAAVHFWLAAPAALIILLLLIVVMLNG